MNKAVPWNINGVGFDAREAAREAARRQGKSLGEWLDGVIADHAAELGVEEQDFGGQDRIDAVTAKLERLSARPGSDTKTRAAAERDRRTPRDRPAPSRAAPRDRERMDDDASRFETAAYRDELDDEGHDTLAPRFRRSDRERPLERQRDERPSVRPRAVAEETEFLLEEAIDAMERRTLRSERKTEKALASFAKIIETTENKRDDERELFSALSRKLSDIETRIASRATDDNYRPIKGALARLEARLDMLGRRGAETAPVAPVQSETARGAPAQVVPVQAAPVQAVSAYAPPIHSVPVVAVRREEDHEPILRLESKLNSILAAIAAKPPAETMQSSPIAMAARMQSTAPIPTGNLAPAYEPESAPIVAPPFANRRLGAAVADIANHQRALDMGSAVRRRAEAPLRAAPAPAPRFETAPPQLAVSGLQGDIASLATKIEEMRRDLVARPSQPAAPLNLATTQIDDLRAEVATMSKMMHDMTPRQALPQQTALPQQIAQMTTALEAMRRDFLRHEDERRRDDAKVAEVASRTDLDGLKTEIAAITETLGQLAPRGTMTALEQAIRNLTTRIETTRDGHTRDAMRPLEAIVGDLRHSLADIDPRSTIGGLEREVRTIGGKLDELNGVDVSALGRIQSQTEEIRALLAAAAANPLAVERIEQQVATLAERMDRQPRPSDRDDQAFRAATDDIRAMLENPPGVALFDKIERRLESLTGKVDQAVMEASGARKVAEASKRHFDNVQAQLASGLGAQVPQASADMRSLEKMVRDLSSKIEAVRGPDASAQAIEALQDQILTLSNRFERTDGELSALSGIERSMQELFTHLEETRASVETSAAKAAREAASAALARGASDPAANREIATLKAIQQEADHRTHMTLNAVHETLEKVVDRLSLMEGDIASVRKPRAEPAPQPLKAPQREVAEAPRPTPGRQRLADRPDLMLGAADELDEPLVAPSPLVSPPRGRGVPFSASRADDLDETAGRADFIAAARRAARAAQNDPSVLAMKRPDAPVASHDVRAGLMAKSRDYVATHKKPILLSIAALFVTIGTLSVMGSINSGDPSNQLAASTSLTPRPAKVAEATPVRRIEPVAPGAGRATLADLSPSTLPKAPLPTSEALSGSDPVTTGSIAPRLPSFAAQAPVASALTAIPNQLKQMADGGNAAAQYEIGARYAEGRGVAKDFAQAASWYEKAAQQGSAPAQYKLASLYEKGLGVGRDKAKARSWYTKAADAGNPRAMHNLAVLVADGDGKPDYAGAVIWFRKAAEYGIHDSQYNLAILLARGLGTPQSLVQSYQWFAVAAQQNDSDAATKRDEVAAKLTPNDLSVAKALASAFHPKTADVAATEIDPPAGGWDGASAPSLVKSQRPKLSSL